VLARVLPFPHDLPVVVFSHGTVSGARTDVVAGGSLLLLLTGELFVVLVPWYWILKLIGNWSSWRRMHLFHPPTMGRGPSAEDRKSQISNLGILGDERGTHDTTTFVTNNSILRHGTNKLHRHTRRLVSCAPRSLQTSEGSEKLYGGKIDDRRDEQIFKTQSTSYVVDR
jgi:hypothetical protein